MPPQEVKGARPNEKAGRQDEPGEQRPQGKGTYHIHQCPFESSSQFSCLRLKSSKILILFFFMEISLNDGMEKI